MKRHLILVLRRVASAVIVLVVLGTVWSVLRSSSAAGGTTTKDEDVLRQNEPNIVRHYDSEDWRLFQVLPPKEAAEMRKKWRNMSAEEKEKFRAEMREKLEGMSEEEKGKLGAQMRGRFNIRREDQYKAIKAIEEQLAKLKESLESSESEARPDFREMSSEERAKLREKWIKVREEQQNAIEAVIVQIAVLQGQRQPTAEGEEFIIVNTGELKTIQELAVEEKAGKTAQRLERITRGQTGLKARTQGLEQRPQRPRFQEKLLQELKSGTKAPAFTLNSFDGKTVSLSDYEGKIVVLEWLNLECPFVKYHYDTAHTMVELANKYKNKNVVWLAVNSTSDTTEQANKEFANKHKLPYPILDDKAGKVGLSYGVMMTPHMLVIDIKGNVAYQGAIDNSPMGRIKEGLVNYVDKALEELTNGKSVSVVTAKPYGCFVKYAK